MDDNDEQEVAATDEKDFPLSVTSIKNAVKSLVHPSTGETVDSLPDPEPVVWDDSDAYDTSHDHRGIALIVIIETFRGHKNRAGSKIDENNLKNTFSSLGFQVRLVRDCSLDELKAVLGNVAKEDHSKSDGFVFAISSHGDESLQKEKSKHMKKMVREDVVFCTDHSLKTRELVLNFSDANCPTLKGKPRLFFLQACRGTSLDDGQEVLVTHDGGDEVDGGVPEVVVSPAPCFKDFLIMCATPPGFFAFRRPTDGSWFIQALCSILEKCDGTKDVLQLLTRVVNAVALEYMSFVPKNADIDKKKQTPVIYSMLTKELYWKVAANPEKYFHLAKMCSESSAIKCPF